MTEDKVQYYNESSVQYKIIMMQEVEKSFKKDFADCEPHVDQLLKLFKRRPR